MSLSNLYFKGCFEDLSDEQKKSLQERCATADVVDRGCGREVNTCGKTIEEIFNLYPIYDPQRGLFNTWGGIPFPWKISNLTENLEYSSTDDKWRVAFYRAKNAYLTGDRVIVIERDGYKICVYEALEDIPALSKAFKKDKWEEICCIETTVQAGLPSLEELKERFSYYSLEFYFKNWEDFASDWSNDLEGLLGDDEWSNARIRREFFYKEGDIVLVDGECEDVLCVFIALKDMPATQEVYDEYVKFKPGEYWQRIYCVPTGRNKCLEYQRTRSPEEGYDVVQVGSLGHYTEFPVPYKLRSKDQSQPLDAESRRRENPTVLSDRDIFNLENSTYPYTTECE